MPTLRSHGVIELFRSLKVSSDLKLGLRRGKAPDPRSLQEGSARPREMSEPLTSGIRTPQLRLADGKDRNPRQEANTLAHDSGYALPEDLTWFFGSGGSGADWLGSVLGDPATRPVWFEPRSGDLFDASWPARYGGGQFVFGGRRRAARSRKVETSRHASMA